MYSKIYDLRQNKYISTDTDSGKKLINSYKQIYNSLSFEGKSKVNKLFNIPNSLIKDINVNIQLNCKYCDYKNIDTNANYCSGCGKLFK